MIQVTGNKKNRITQDDLKPGLHRILIDGKMFLHASGVLCPIVWNCIIGANFDNDIDHENYCKLMEVKTGCYEFVSEFGPYNAKPFTHIDSCQLTIKL